MKHKLLFFCILIPLLMTSCIKEDDFEALNHSIAIEGDFTPAYGLPIAKMSANMEQFIGMIHNTHTVSIYIDENDIVSFRYVDTLSGEFSFDGEKRPSTKGGSLNTLNVKKKITSSTNIGLFDGLEVQYLDNIDLQAIYTSLKVQLKANVDANVSDLLEHGVSINFDSLTVLGYSKQSSVPDTLPISLGDDTIAIQDLINGKELQLLDYQDISYLIALKPNRIDISMNMNLTAHVNQFDESTGNAIAYIKDSLGIKSIDYTLFVNLDFPLEIYCSNITYSDTISLDGSSIDSLLTDIDNYATLEGEHNYLLIDAENSFPIDLTLHAQCYDTVTHNLVGGPIIVGDDNVLKGASVVENPYDANNQSYMSSGATPSKLKIGLTSDIIDGLRHANALIFSVGLNTARPTSGGFKPHVVVRGSDQVKLRTFLALAPHIHINTPIN